MSLAPLSSPAVIACNVRKPPIVSLTQHAVSPGQLQPAALRTTYLCCQRFALQRAQVSGPSQTKDVRHETLRRFLLLE